MRKCPKCGSRCIIGPRFKRVFILESLEYTCGQCGYQENTETNDARKAILEEKFR